MANDAGTTIELIEDKSSASYDKMLLKIVIETRKNGSFLEIYFLSSDPGIKKSLWKFVQLPLKKQLLIQDMIEAVSCSEKQTTTNKTGKKAIEKPSKRLSMNEFYSAAASR
jgi:hypothetical protein